MNGYFEKVRNNKVGFKLKLIKAVNNESLSVTYSLYTNLHMDFGICPDEWLRTLSTKKKKRVNRYLQNIKLVTGKKLKLTATDNDKTYTRLIYTFE